jgi:hypothetical protein
MAETELAKAAEADKKKVNWDRLDVEIEHVGRAITLPGDPGKMPIVKAIEALQRKLQDEETVVQVYEIIDAYPLDGAVAFVKAMANLYGWASPIPTPGFFGPKPPTIISVKTGPGVDDVVQCPVGTFKLPGVSHPIGTDLSHIERGKAMFVIHAQVKKKEKHLLLELANETRRIVAAESIYRGKPIRLSVDSDGDLDMNTPPDFLDVSDTTEASLLFNDDIRDQINTNILVPIKETDTCRRMKIPLKRGILLEGPYGTGKSLTARMAAKVAQDNGWTFILLDKVQGLRVALEFANRYSPAVVFAEDIDRVASERDEDANDLINTIDGVVSKRAEIMTILTTNFVENLNPVILRPGRLDAVISLRAPDAETVQKLLRLYAGKLLPDDAVLTGAGQELAGQIPASIRECVERAKLGMIGRGDKKLDDRDIVIAAQTMKNHLALLNRKSAEETEPEKLAKSLKAVIGNGAEGHFNRIEAGVDKLCDRFEL